MNKERFRKLFKRLKDFILCCKKTVDEVDSVLEDINELQLFTHPKTGEIMVIYQQPTDAIAMQHDVDYSVCKDDKRCKNKADRKMVQALDNVPYNERQ